MKIMGAKHSILGLDGSEQWEKIKEMSGYIRLREGNINREITDTVNRMSPMVNRFEIAGKDFSWKDVQDFMFEWIQMNDRAVIGPVWLGAYNKYIKENAKKDLTDVQKHKNAVERADVLIRDTQASTLPADLSSVQRAEGALRLFTSFMSSTFKYGNLVLKYNRLWREGKYTNKQYFKHIMYDTMMQSWAGAIMSSLLATGDLPEWWEIGTAPVEMLLSWIPFFRDIAGALKYRTPVGSTTAFEGLNRAVKAGKSAWEVTQGDKEFYDAMWDLGRAIEFQYGVPALKVVKDMDRMYNNVTGQKKTR